MCKLKCECLFFLAGLKLLACKLPCVTLPLDENFAEVALRCAWGHSKEVPVSHGKWSQSPQLHQYEFPHQLKDDWLWRMKGEVWVLGLNEIWPYPVHSHTPCPSHAEEHPVYSVSPHWILHLPGSLVPALLPWLCTACGKKTEEVSFHFTAFVTLVLEQQPRAFWSNEQGTIIQVQEHLEYNLASDMDVCRGLPCCMWHLDPQQRDQNNGLDQTLEVTQKWNQIVISRYISQSK